MSIKKIWFVVFLVYSLSVLLVGLEERNFFLVKKGKFIDSDTLTKKIQGSDIIYVGETHNQSQCHIAQVKTIMALNEIKKGKIVVGFEMLNHTLQETLNEYAEGKISDEEFLKKTNWEKEWGFDFSLYEPIFSYIRTHKLKALALNVPKDIISKIARGGIESLSDEEKKFIARKIKINKDKNYLKYLKESFSGHGETPMSKMLKWENYLLSMAVWNETMGEKIADFLNENKDYSCVIIAGNGHIIYNAGIPWSVKKRTKKLKHLSIYTENSDNRETLTKSKDKIADVIWFVPFDKK